MGLINGMGNLARRFLVFWLTVVIATLAIAAFVVGVQVIFADKTVSAAIGSVWDMAAVYAIIGFIAAAGKGQGYSSEDGSSLSGINPATGLPSIGGVDTGGNAWGDDS